MIDDALGRILRLLGGLLGVHLEYAQREASRDLGRVAAGLVLAGIALLLAGLVLLLVNAALVALLHEGGRPLVHALLLVAAGDLVVGVLAALIARAQLRRPVLSETRAVLRRTVIALKDA